MPLPQMSGSEFGTKVFSQPAAGSQTSPVQELLSSQSAAHTEAAQAPCSQTCFFQTRPSQDRLPHSVPSSTGALWHPSASSQVSTVHSLLSLQRAATASPAHSWSSQTPLRHSRYAQCRVPHSAPSCAHWQVAGSQHSSLCGGAGSQFSLPSVTTPSPQPAHTSFASSQVPAHGGSR